MVDLWPDHRVHVSVPSPAVLAELSQVLNDSSDEVPLQAFLATHPECLRGLVPPRPDVWCFDRPSFGGELVPDFLLAFRDSTGINWLLVELESPTAPVMLKDGQPAAKLRAAWQQIRNWRIWLRANIAYARNQLGFKDIDAECGACVVIGRRAFVDAKMAVKYRELSSPGNMVLSFDRLVEMTSALVR